MNRVIQSPFLQEGDTFTVDAEDTSTATQIGGSSTVDSSIAVWNSSQTSTCYVRVGSSSVTASASTSLPIPPGQIFNLHVGNVNTHLAAICDSAETATIFVTPGVGKL